MDPFGCDLQIYGSNVTNGGVCKRKEKISVFLGGRNVYAFYEDRPERIIHGFWEKLLEGLWRYELAVCFDEPCCIDNALVEMCKSESLKNRNFFKDISEKGSAVAMRYGELEAVSEKTFQYKLETKVDGHELAVVLSLANGSPEALTVYYEREKKFIFHYNRMDISNLFRDKGYYLAGEWEEAINKLYEAARTIECEASCSQ